MSEFGLPSLSGSFLGLPLSLVSNAALEAVAGSVIVRARNIGGFVADVTVKEIHDDELVVTDNPVEQGAAITDHSFKRPAQLRIEAGWSNSSLPGSLDPNYVQTIYAAFLLLQASRVPIEVITGKRVYTNMLITRIHTETTEEWENAMIMEVDLREIILVNTQTVSVPPSANMAAPQINGAVQNTGFSQVTPGNNFNSAASPVL